MKVKDTYITYYHNVVITISDLILNKEVKLNQYKSVFPVIIQRYLKVSNQKYSQKYPKSHHFNSDRLSKSMTQSHLGIAIDQSGLPLVHGYSDQEIMSSVKLSLELLPTMDIINLALDTASRYFERLNQLNASGEDEQRNRVVDKYKALLLEKLGLNWKETVPQDRNALLRKHIERGSKFIRFSKLEVSKRINVKADNISIEGQDLSNMDLTRVDFNTISIKNVNFMDSKISAEQLYQAKHIACALNIEKSTYEKAIKLRFNRYMSLINKDISSVDMIINFAGNLDKLDLLVNENYRDKFRVSDNPDEIKNVKAVISRDLGFAIFISPGLNILKGGHPWSFDSIAILQFEGFSKKPILEINNAIKELIKKGLGRDVALVAETKSRLTIMHFNSKISFLGRRLSDYKSHVAELGLEEREKLSGKVQELERNRQVLKDKFKFYHGKNFKGFIDALLTSKTIMSMGNIAYAIEHARDTKVVVDLSRIDLSEHKSAFQKLDIRNTHIHFSTQQKISILSDDQKHVYYGELYGVIKAGRVERFRDFIQARKIGYDEFDTLNRTPLMIASELNKIEIVEYLVSVGASLSKLKSPEGENICILEYVFGLGGNRREVYELLKSSGAYMPLWVAVASSDNRKARSLLSINNCNQPCYLNGQTPLHIAAIYRNRIIAQFLVQTLKARTNIKDVKGRSALWYASVKGYLLIVRLLCPEKLLRTIVDKNNMKLSRTVAEAGRKDVLRLLVDRQLDIDMSIEIYLEDFIKIKSRLKSEMMFQDIDSKRTVKPDYKSYLYWSAYYGSLDVTRFLVDKGASLKVKFSGQNTLAHIAAKNNHQSVLKFLVDKGGSLLVTNDHNLSPLYLLLQKGATGAFEWFVNYYNVDINKIHGTVPLLHLAVQNKDVQLVSFLISKKIDLNVLHNNMSILHLAASINEADLIDLLLMHGANPLQPDKQGVLPIHIAAKYGLTRNAACIAQKMIFTKCVYGNPQVISNRKRHEGTSSFFTEVNSLLKMHKDKPNSKLAKEQNSTNNSNFFRPLKNTANLHEPTTNPEQKVTL